MSPSFIRFDCMVCSSRCSSFEYNIRLRLNLVADPDYNPFGFEMATEGEREKLLAAIAATTKVSVEKVTFMSYLPEYRPVETCQDQMQCNLEVSPSYKIAD